MHPRTRTRLRRQVFEEALGLVVCIAIAVGSFFALLVFGAIIHMVVKSIGAF